MSRPADIVEHHSLNGSALAAVLRAALLVHEGVGGLGFLELGKCFV